MIDPSLFEKYDVPAPRYTSYPTVPYWEKTPKTEEWFSSVENTLKKTKRNWSMYIHVPFCEKLCSFCGCNTVITQNHKKEKPYIELLSKEFELYLSHAPSLEKVNLGELHIGGGTPTFLSSKNLSKLCENIIGKINKSENWIGSIEVHPNYTNEEQLRILRNYGFSRISLGIQDFNIEVQKLINRIQSFETTKKITDIARKLGYTSINYDLIYGLPKQNLSLIKNTIKKTLELRPNRIALYSLAFIPWLKPSQKLFQDKDLPKAKEKIKLYEYSREALLEAGYQEIGMDHFALYSDDLAIAYKKKHLHRNFMGYTPFRTDVLVGLGLSSISETPDFFHQNLKKLDEYKTRINQKNLATLKGHSFTEEDKIFREMILKFMSTGRVKISSTYENWLRTYLSEMLGDKLIKISNEEFKITKKGKPFLRNACMALDKRLQKKNPQHTVFSKAL